MFNRLREITRSTSAFLMVVGLSIPVAADATTPVEWQDLPDPASQEFEDPYRDLGQETLEGVIEVARLRAMQEQTGSLQGDDAARLEASLTSLKEQGIDADVLISQRWIVAERREAAATLGNAAFDGAEVTISGFAIPAPPETDGTSVAYLVEQRGMCSHMPPPMPNQMIRVRLTSDWTPDYMHQPVSLTGRLRINPTQEVFRVVDGEVPMSATWQLDTVAVQTYSAAPLAAEASSEWVDQLRAKLKANKAETGE